MESKDKTLDRAVSDQHMLYVLIAGLIIGSGISVLLYSNSAHLSLVTGELLLAWASAFLVYFVWKKPFDTFTRTGSSRQPSKASWIRRWLVTTNHRDVGVLYILTAFYMAFVGGALALLMRAQLMFPGGRILVGLQYNQAVSAHGLVMVLWFLSPLAVGLANYVVPLQIGAEDLAFPRLNALSYWLYAFSSLLLASSFFMPGGTVNAGWTLYAPLNSSRYMPGPGPTAALLALIMLIASVTATGVNFLVTVATMRAPGVTLSRVPMFTWFVVFTLIQMVFAFPTVLAAALMLDVGRIAGTLYFTNVASGASMLWDNLFWYFGHPEVYIILLPAFGALAEIIPTFSGRQTIYGKKVFLMATFTTVIPLSFFIWGHHMYTTVLPLFEKEVFEVGTELISVPFGLMVFGFLWTLETGRIRLKTPMLFALGALTFFIIGGITGVFLSSIVLDQEFRGAYFVVAHFHYIMVGTTLFGLLGAIYYWFPMMTGRMFSEKLGRIHFVLSFAFFNLTFFPMFFLYQMPRRIFTYSVPAWATPNLIASAGAFLFGGIQVLMVINLVYSIVRGQPAPLNPWQAMTREWETSEQKDGTGEAPVLVDTMAARMPVTQVLPRRQAVMDLAQPSTNAPPISEAKFFPPLIKRITTMPFAVSHNRRPTEVNMKPVSSADTVERPMEEPDASIMQPHHESGKPVTIAGGMALALAAFPLVKFYVVAGPLFATGAALAFYGLFGWASDSVSGRFSASKLQPSEHWPFTGTPRMKLAVWVLLLSEVVMFATILTSDMYVRILTPNWPSTGSLHPLIPGVVSTIALLTSSLTGFMALGSVKSGMYDRASIWLIATIVLGGLFVGVEAGEWIELFTKGLGPSTNNALSTYFFTTGVHMAHVLSGLLVAGYLLARLVTPRKSTDWSSLEAWAIYWSFVDAIWVLIFIFFYLG